MQIPEKIENFTITLLNTTGGARLGSNLSAKLSIRENDDPIYFAGMFVIHYNVNIYLKTKRLHMSPPLKNPALLLTTHSGHQHWKQEC